MNKIQKKITFLKKCKICGNKNLKKLMAINEQFLSSRFVKSNKNNNLKKIKTKLTLVMCYSKNKSRSCGHVQLYEMVKQDLLYRKYYYRSSTSHSMRLSLNDVVKDLLKIVNPKKNDIALDIGSNDNTLLNFYPKKLKLYGFEPAKNIIYHKKNNKISVINNYFNAKEYFKCSKNKAKIISSCAMFYDLRDPNKFVSDINEVINDEGVWCVQISYLLSMIKNMNFYDICHEHLSYHSIDSIEKLIIPHDLKIFKIETNLVNGGSIRFYICKATCKSYDKKQNYNKINKLKKLEKKFNLKSIIVYKNFDKKITNFKNIINNFISKIQLSNEKIIGLGASTKGNILLQHFGIEKKQISYISERNKEKVGLKCVGTDIELISEKKARKLKPNYMLVLPWYFKNEIINREKKYLQNGGRLLFPLPYPHVITSKKEIKIN